MSDPGADFAEFYLSSKARVLRAVTLAAGSTDDAEDAVAEAFVRACQRWRRLRRHPNPVGWVTLVAMNHLREGWRRTRRHSRTDTLVASQGHVSEPELPLDPMLVEALAGLPRRQRQVVALRVVLDQSVSQTAELLGLAEGTVRAHLHRALEALRSSIEIEEAR